MKKIFVTGASGLIGSNIVELCLQNGDQIIALKRATTNISEFDQYPTIQWVEGDLFDYHFLIDVLQHVDYIIHCAAVVSFNPRDKQLMFATNIEGTRNLVNAALASNIKRIVYLSSVAALGKTLDNKPVDETTAWTTTTGRANYDISKYYSELEIWRGAEEGLEVNMINPSVVLGVGNWTQSSSKLFKFIYNNSRFYTDGFLNYVDVRDVALAAYKLIDSPQYNQKYILCAGHIDFRSFYSKVAKAYKKPSPTIFIPIIVLKIWQKIEALKVFFFNASPLITKETIAALQRPTTYNSHKSVKDLNIKYHDLDNTITWVTQSYVNKYKLL